MVLKEQPLFVTVVSQRSSAVGQLSQGLKNNNNRQDKGKPSHSDAVEQFLISYIR